MSEPQRKMVSFIECEGQGCPARSYVITLSPRHNALPWCKHHFERYEVTLMLTGHRVTIDDRPWLYWAEGQHQRLGGRIVALPASPARPALPPSKDEPIPPLAPA